MYMNVMLLTFFLLLFCVLGMRVTLRVKDFPYKHLNSTTNKKSKSRLAFRFLITCDDYSSEFALFDLRRLANRQKPSNLDNGYFEWQPNARVKFPGSNHMFNNKYKEQPLRPSRRLAKDAGTRLFLLDQFCFEIQHTKLCLFSTSHHTICILLCVL